MSLTRPDVTFCLGASARAEEYARGSFERTPSGVHFNFPEFGEGHHYIGDATGSILNPSEANP